MSRRGPLAREARGGGASSEEPSAGIRGGTGGTGIRRKKESELRQFVATAFESDHPNTTEAGHGRQGRHATPRHDRHQTRPKCFTRSPLWFRGESGMGAQPRRSLGAARRHRRSQSMIMSPLCRIEFSSFFFFVLAPSVAFLISAPLYCFHWNQGDNGAASRIAQNKNKRKRTETLRIFRGFPRDLVA